MSLLNALLKKTAAAMSLRNSRLKKSSGHEPPELPARKQTAAAMSLLDTRLKKPPPP
ncbi:MAG: hypothetical protein LBW85_13335 [Deltaproteobacteria bacterium]|jgi:hypothetical protein|nr:hypothetical protein [Deltaproteobacteria bacterium]